jgi:hypothetical protein
MSPRIAILAVAFACSSAAPPPAPPLAPKLVADLNGRAAGKAQRCVSVHPGVEFSTSDENPHLLLYDDGETIWASNLAAGCGFGPSESVVPAGESASFYCRGDFVKAGSRMSVSPFGARCVLGNFTPYRSAK